MIFSTGHYTSKTRKSAQILCNAAGNVPRLTIIADIVPNPDSINVFQVSPSLLDLDKDRPQDQKHPWEYQFTVKNVSTEDLKFTIVSKPDRYMQLDFPENKKIGPGSEKIFKVKFDQKMADDLFSKSLTIEASDSTHTRFTVPISKARRWGPAPTSSR